MNEQENCVSLTIDGIQVTAAKGTTVWNATQQLGIDIPIFCYQDRMPPFGACRVCLVEVEKMPKLQTSCTLEVAEGMVVRTQATTAVQARDEILEFLLINHPLDCPICDRGGECPLQDQAYKFGPGKSRFFEEKRHFKKPLALGPVLTLDRERCIACARCTRFGDIIAGDHALEFIDRGYKTEVGTADGKAPKSKFIGNTIMICPVGALTSSVYRFRARPWDNYQTKTTCTLCPVGCSMILDSRDGEIMRTRSSENKAVNDIWLCDKGWFGYEFSESSLRLRFPLIRKEGSLVPVSWDEAFSFVAEKMLLAKQSKRLAAFGGPVLTVEEQYLLQKLFRDALQSPHLDHRVGMPTGRFFGMEMEIEACERLSHIVFLGIDITEEFPVLWLRLKQAINNGAKVLFLGHFLPEVARYFEKSILHAPKDAVHTLQEHASILREYMSGPSCAFFVGRQYLNSTSWQEVAELLFSWKKEFSGVFFNFLDAEENSLGAQLAGMHPELLPGGVLSPNPGMSCTEVLKQAASSGWDLLYVVGCNPAVKYPSSLWKEARKNLGCLIVQDLFLTETALQADVVLPALCFLEKGGSFLTIERRVQKLKPGKEIPKGVFSDSYIFIRIAQRLGAVLVIDEPFLDMLKENSRVASSTEVLPSQNPPPKQKEGIEATFSKQLFDSGTRMQHNEQLFQLVKEGRILMCPELAGAYNFKENDLVTISGNDGSFDGYISIRPQVAQNTVVIPLGVPFMDGKFASELGVSLVNGMKISLKSIR
jgi:NADH-quinone oxidoreductase subunit G